MLDGSIIPTSIGANPSLTIAALAERAIDNLVAKDLDRLLARPTGAARLTETDGSVAGKRSA